MADETIDTLFGKIRANLRKRQQQQQDLLDDIAGKAFDAYRAAMGDNFTTQEVIKASHYGFKVEDWNSLDPEMQYTLSALCVKHPESVDREKASQVLSDAVVTYLREHELSLSDEQAQLFPHLMNGIMQGLEQAGATFGNNVRQAHILGLIPLVHYRNWLVNAGSHFMDYNDYELELRLTENAIKANQNVLTTALVAAEDVNVDYGMFSGGSKRISGITKAGISDQRIGGSPFVVTYETKDGKKGKIDVLQASLTSLTEEADRHRIVELFYKKKINESGENLGYEGSIESLVGLPESISSELRANVWRKYLKRFEVDFSKNAEVVLVDPLGKEKVSFYYATQNRKKEDNGVMVGFTFDERYGSKHVFVCSRARMVADIESGRRIQKLDEQYKPLLDPLSVRTYVENKRRLTHYRP